MRRMSQPLTLEDGRPPRVASATLYTLSGFVVAALVWAGIAEVREIAVAPGQIVPTGSVHAVQHLEGGIVAEILVRDGARVNAGDVVMRLAPAQSGSDLDQMRVRRTSLRLQLERLDAHAAGRSPEFGDLQRSAPVLAADQTAMYFAEETRRRREEETLVARIGQRRAEAVAAEAESEVARAQVGIAREQMSIQDRLLRSGYTSRRAHLEAQAMLRRAEAEEVAIGGRMATTRQGLREAEMQLAEAMAVSRRRLAEERAKAAAELAEVEEQIVKLNDRFDRLLVRAPSTGVIQDLVPKSTGEVVRPGEVIARVVPSERELVAEVRIDPKDIGHVRVGARADMTLSTFDTATFGNLIGRVERIAATTSLPEPGQPQNDPMRPAVFYRAIVTLPDSHVGIGALRRPILPGMAVQANIVTGERSILRYMLKPVFRSLDQAFTER